MAKRNFGLATDNVDVAEAEILKINKAMTEVDNFAANLKNAIGGLSAFETGGLAEQVAEIWNKEVEVLANLMPTWAETEKVLKNICNCTRDNIANAANGELSKLI